MSASATNATNVVERWRGLMDETVLEVFATMLGLECLPTEPADTSADNTTARIVFSGALLGECVLIFADIDAAKLAEMFLGGAADDAMIDDAMGELCNVLAGGWKRRLKPPASGAGLSVPVVAHGANCSSSGLRQAYEFDGTQFAVGLTVDTVTED